MQLWVTRDSPQHLDSVPRRWETSTTAHAWRGQEKLPLLLASPRELEALLLRVLVAVLRMCRLQVLPQGSDAEEQGG